MFYKFAEGLGRKFELIRKNFPNESISGVASDSGRVSADTEVRSKAAIKAVSGINDRSNNNAEDLGRGINELLAETTLTEDVREHFKRHYQNVLAYYTNIGHYTKEQIFAEAVRLRGNPDLDIDLVIALMNRANKIATGFELRPAQILSILEFFREDGVNKFCQINTGEGKTTVTSAIAVIKSLQGETVDIITSNEVLAQDAVRARADFYALFNLSVAHNNADLKYSKGVRDCYTNDIVYGTIGNFEFDYLRHRVQLLNTKGDRKFGSLIIDEADNVVLDNAVHVAKTSGPVPGMEALKYVYLDIWRKLIQAEEVLGLKDTELAKITVADRQFIKILMGNSDIKSHSMIPKFLESYVDRKLDGWINNAIRARYDYHQNQHYIIDKKDVEKQNANAEENIIPLDVAVGVTQQNMIWTDLHPFIQIKHNLQITPDSLTSVFIANSEYIRLYKDISGLTGTLGSKEEQGVIKTLYNANSTIIPTYKAGRMIYETNLLVADNIWLKTVAADAIDHSVNQNRAALIVCNTMQDVLELEAQFAGIDKVSVITYMDEHDAYKIEAINNGSGIKPGAIVIATNIGGRGTDIKLSDEVKENGGLHECTTFIASSRILKQALGRAGRQGEPGSARIIIKRQDVEELGLNLGNNFSNQDIYDLVDEINNQRIIKFIPQIKRVEEDGKYFAKFADLYTKGKSLELNHFILEDLKLQWSLAFDERNDAKITELFTKFNKAIDNNQNYDHRFINPYFAVNYADYILATGFKSGKEEEIVAGYDKAKHILNQDSITADPELIYSSNIKLFELTIGLAQRNELKRLADNRGDADSTELSEYEYKGQAKKYLENARQALDKRIEYLEDMIAAKNFRNIILPQDALNNNGTNCMLKHLESRYATLQLQLRYVDILGKRLDDSDNNLIYISAQHSLNELIEKIGSKELSEKIYRQEIMRLSNAGENSFSNLQVLPNVTEDNPKIRAAMYDVAAGFAESALNLPSFTKVTSSMRNSLIGSGIFDIMKVIFSSPTQAEAQYRPFDALALSFAKVVERLKILHKVGKYVAEDIIGPVVNNGKFFTEFIPKVTERLEIFQEELASIRLAASVKAPESFVLKKPVGKEFKPNKALRGSDITKEQDIDGVDAYFGKYTLDAVRNILKLRIADAGIDKTDMIKVTDNDYSFIDKNSNNIQDLIDELTDFTDSGKVLVPLSLSNKHAVGMICRIEYNENENKNNLKIFYIDPENNPIPTELGQIFNFNRLNIEQLTMETQEYANCGPEIIENFMLYLTGERLSQTEAIPYHSLLVERALLRNGNHHIDSLDNNRTATHDEIDITGIICNSTIIYDEAEISLIGLLPDFAEDIA